MAKEISFEEYRELIAKIDPDADCPVNSILEIFAGKWNTRVLFELTKADSIRFGSMQKQIGGITNTMLAATLKNLEESGLLIRTQFNEIPPHVEYALSEKGKEIYPIFIEMADWAHKYK